MGSMYITDCRRLGKGRYEICLNGEAAFVLYKGDLSRYDLKTGDELTDEMRERIYTETLCGRAVNRLLYLLQSRDYTRCQLAEKLRQGQYPDEIREKALDTVQSYGYIDDESYARRYVECRSGRKSMGRIRQELLQKGISRDLAEAAVEEGREKYLQEGDGEKEQIRRLLEKRHFNGKEADRREIDRQYAYLARRGYSSSDILSVFRELT